jgi:hypothetical protein
MIRIRSKPTQHSNNTLYINKNTGFSGIPLKNQPNTPLYKPLPPPKNWWMQGDILKVVTGITAYINLGSKTGFGIGDSKLNYGGVPLIIDRASPFMWL